MYQLEKHYVVLAKEGKKLTNAGLLKTSLNDRKIRAEYFLNVKEIQKAMGATEERISMECVLKYMQEGDMNAAKSWKKTLTKTDSHFIFAIESQKKMLQIADCRLLLPGNRVIVADEKMSKTVTDSEEILEPTAALKSERESEAASEPESISEAENVLKPENVSEQKVMSQPVRQIEYIRDLDYLKSGNEEMQQLSYNSFLLHGFYQYRYFIIGKNFIGVPDHFYEREAIAAKMMGFPYFMEADFVETCCLDGEIRSELPKTGSFGYYLKKLLQ